VSGAKPAEMASGTMCAARRQHTWALDRATVSGRLKAFTILTGLRLARYEENYMGPEHSGWAGLHCCRTYVPTSVS